MIPIEHTMILQSKIVTLISTFGISINSRDKQKAAAPPIPSAALIEEIKKNNTITILYVITISMAIQINW